MKKLFGFLFIFSFLTSNAQAVWKIRDRVLDVVPCPNKDCYVSKSCVEKNNSCEAMKAYKSPQAGKYVAGGPNPGSAVCSEVLKGAVNIAQDEEGNQEGFCIFKDNSIISLGGIWK